MLKVARRRWGRNVLCSFYFSSIVTHICTSLYFLLLIYLSNVQVSSRRSVEQMYTVLIFLSLLYTFLPLHIVLFLLLKRLAGDETRSITDLASPMLLSCTCLSRLDDHAR